MERKQEPPSWSLRPTIFAAVLVAGLMVFAGAAQAHGGGGRHGGGSAASKYERWWEDFSPKSRDWARAVSQCESGGDRNIHGGGGAYHGAFQFTIGTWRTSPRSPGADPHTRTWRTQAVVAVFLMKRDGTGPWPVCG